MLKTARVIRWGPRPDARRTESTPCVQPSGAASHLDPLEHPAGFSPTWWDGREARTDVRPGASSRSYCARRRPYRTLVRWEAEGLVEVGRPSGHAEVTPLDRLGRLQGGRAALIDNLALAHHVRAVGHAQSEVIVLFHEQQGQPIRPERLEDAPDLAH